MYNIRVNYRKRCFEFFTHGKKVFPIWYLLNCPADSKEEILRFIQKNRDKNVIEDVFTVSYDRMKRYQGAWHLECRPLLPETIFLSGEDQDAVSNWLQEALPSIEKCISSYDLNCFSEGARGFLEELSGRNHHICFSRGYIRNGKTYITEGPLKGKEMFIRKIDRHKRLAKVLVPFSDMDAIETGLEIYAKD